MFSPLSLVSLLFSSLFGYLLLPNSIFLYCLGHFGLLLVVVQEYFCYVLQILSFSRSGKVILVAVQFIGVVEMMCSRSSMGVLLLVLVTMLIQA